MSYHEISAAIDLLKSIGNKHVKLGRRCKKKKTKVGSLIYKIC